MAEQKAAATAKREATRAARGTKSATAKKGIKGTVTGVAVTPIVAGAPAVPRVDPQCGHRVASRRPPDFREPAGEHETPRRVALFAERLVQRFNRDVQLGAEPLRSERVLLVRRGA